MSSVTSLLVMSLLSAAGGQGTPVPSQPSAEPATVTFVSEGQALAGIAHGIDAIDAERRAFGERLSATVPAGLRTVWYSCPDEPRMKDGSRLSFDFVGGRHYQLQCRAGQDAVIRESDDC